MDWKCGDLLLGSDMEEFRIEKTVKTNKVSIMIIYIYIDKYAASDITAAISAQFVFGVYIV